MSQPDARPFTIKRITKTTDKFAAVCYIYEGQHFQDLCRVQNSDGTFNFSEKCLAQLPYHGPYFGDTDLTDGQYSVTNGSSSSSSLTPYRGQDHAVARYEPGQSAMPPFRMFVTHYWLPILVLILGIFLLAFAIAQYIIPIIWRKSSRNQRDMVNQDKDGYLSIGKIKFHPNDVLGTGSKGTYVYKGSFENSQECAIKRIVAQTITFADREVDFLRSLQHPNLVRYLATEHDPQFIFIALELADCTLRALIEGHKMVDFGLSKEEICKQSALGLQYLHKLDIVHRDIKPENILVSLPKRPNDRRCIMITDFGLSKQLTSMETYHSSSVMRYFDGTQGWMPPEIIKAKEENKNLLPSKSADIFSLGCVFYFIIFDGKHPFGSAPNEREENIKANRNELDRFGGLGNKENISSNKVSEEIRVMGNDLIGAMIMHDASERPPIDSILKYPLFWTKKQSLQFLSEVSDRLDSKDPDNLAKRVESGRKRVFGYDWKSCLSEPLLRDINEQKHRSYNERSLQHLLRLIRNKNNHYNDCSAALKLDFGSPPDDFFTYFSSRFPELIIHVYKAMQELKKETKFCEYYEQDEEYAFPRMTV